MAILTDADITLVINRLGGLSVIGTADATMLRDDVIPEAEVMVRDFLGWNVEQADYSEYYPEVDMRLVEAPLDSRYSMTGYGYRQDVSNPVSEIFTRQYPIRAVANVWENQDAWQTDPVNGDWSEGFKLVPGSDYTVEWDELGLSEKCSLRRFGSWSPVRKSIRVDYTAGLSAGELALPRWSKIKQAVKLTVQKHYLDITVMRRNGAVTGTEGFGLITYEQLKDYRASFSVGFMEKMFGFTTTLPPQAVKLLEKLVYMHKFISI